VFSTPARRFLIFIAASVVLHVLLFTGLPRILGATTPEPTALTAEIVALNEPMAEPAVADAPTPAPKAPRPAVPTAIVTDQAPPPPPATPPSQPSPEPPPADTSAPETPEKPEETPKPPIETIPEKPRPTITTSAPPIRDLPRAGTIKYDVSYGGDRAPIGRTVSTFALDASAYRLSSIWETTGVVSLFRPIQLSYSSEGRIDSGEGFVPELFQASLNRRGREGERQAAARFDWPALRLQLGSPARGESVALSRGTLDRLSFIFQLARSDLSPKRTQLRITDGNKLETYTIEIGETEVIDVPLGMLRSVPIRQIRAPGQESIEIWLAPDQHYLPVRIRHFNRDGKMGGEQSATEIILNG